MPAPENLLALRNVTKHYAANGATNNVPVLDGISLEVARGASLAIVGPSGSGKSTLLQIIGTLDRTTSGEVLLAGKNLAALDELQLAAVRNQQIGFVFQAHYLLPQCTVLENVLVPTLAGGARAKIEVKSQKSEQAVETSAARAERLLQRVGLGERLRVSPVSLADTHLRLTRMGFEPALPLSPDESFRRIASQSPRSDHFEKGKQSVHTSALG